MAVLLVSLSCPMFAGEMHTGSPTTAPPPPPSATPEPTEVETDTDGITNTPSVSECLTEVALDLLTILPSLF
jgi:hypothetical protein